MSLVPQSCRASTFLHCAQVCIEIVGYLLEELRDNKNYEEFKKDVANANIFIGSLIFIEELAEKVRMRLHVHPAASAALMKETQFALCMWVLADC